MAGSEKCEAGCDFERCCSADDDEARVAGFAHCLNEAARYRDELIRVIGRRHVGADDRVGAGNDLGDAFDVAEVVADGVGPSGELAWIADSGGDLVTSRLKLTKDARAGVSGCAVKDDFHAGCLLNDDARKNQMR